MFLLLKNKDHLLNDMQGSYHVLQGRGYVFFIMRKITIMSGACA